MYNEYLENLYKRFNRKYWNVPLSENNNFSFVLSNNEIFEYFLELVCYGIQDENHLNFIKNTVYNMRKYYNGININDYYLCKSSFLMVREIYNKILFKDFVNYCFKNGAMDFNFNVYRDDTYKLKLFIHKTVYEKVEYGCSFEWSGYPSNIERETMFLNILSDIVAKKIDNYILKNIIFSADESLKLNDPEKDYEFGRNAYYKSQIDTFVLKDKSDISISHILINSYYIKLYNDYIKNIVCDKETKLVSSYSMPKDHIILLCNKCKNILDSNISLNINNPVIFNDDCRDFKIYGEMEFYKNNNSYIKLINVDERLLEL